MSQPQLEHIFPNRLSRFEWKPCNTPKDYATMQEINTKMDEVRLDFAHKSAQSIAVAQQMILRRGR